MDKNSKKSTGNRQVKFTKASERLRKRIVKALAQISDAHAALRTSIMEAGKALTQLRAMAKKHHIAFAGIVEGAPYNLPVTTAYHYMRCFKKASELKPRVYTLALDAGFDPAQPRVLSYLKKNQARVGNMTPFELGQKLNRTKEKQSTRSFFVKALKAYARYLVRRQGKNTSEIKSMLSALISNSVTPTLVAKAA